MKNVRVLLNNVEKVKDFVDLIEKSGAMCEIGDGNYFVDARSIIGIFSLDTSKPLDLKIDGNSFDTLVEKINKYVVN
ncbi:MAG: HPr family phosphocarrier protein [Clostridiales bacterium]|nr:HPr family phosphocarrier protein [Clostridiales bacterium]